MWSCLQECGYTSRIHVLYTIDKEGIYRTTWHEQPYLTSVRLKPAQRVSCCGSACKSDISGCHLLCISLGCCDTAQPQWGTSVRCWNDAAQPGHFRGHWAFGLAPQPAAAHTQSALQWNLFMPLEKKWNLKARLLLFFSLTASQKEGRNNGGIGLLQLSIETYCWNARHYYEDMPAVVQSSQNDPHS